MKILITGADGFIGSYFVDECEQLSLDYHTVGGNKGSLTSDTDWSDALCDVSVIVHLAGCAHGDYSVDEYRQLEFYPTQRLLKDAQRANVKQFIYLSSTLVYGNYIKKISSDSEICADNSIAEHKILMEELIKNACESSEMSFTIIRTPLVYGPKVKANFLNLIKLCKANIPLPLRLVNRNKRSMIYVGNLSDFIFKTLNNYNAINRSFLVADEQSLSTVDLLRKLKKGLGKTIFLFPVPVFFLRLIAKLIGKELMVERLTNSCHVDCSETKNRLSWKPLFDTDTAIELTCKDFLEYKK